MKRARIRESGERDRSFKSDPTDKATIMGEARKIASEWTSKRLDPDGLVGLGDSMRELASLVTQLVPVGGGLTDLSEVLRALPEARGAARDAKVLEGLVDEAEALVVGLEERAEEAEYLEEVAAHDDPDLDAMVEEADGQLRQLGASIQRILDAIQ